MTAGASGKRGPSASTMALQAFSTALPALVAIHRIVAAAHGRDRDRFRQRGEQTIDVFGRRLRRRVTTVRDGVNEGGHAGVDQDPGQRRGVVLMRMHAPGRHQADKMASAAALLELVDQLRERRHAVDLALGDGIADPRQVLDHDASGADVEVADLRIAHLPVGQADVLARGAQEAVRPRPP